MTCQSCYDNCSEIQSDKCIKYTGIDISELDIKKGDSLLSVEQKIITFLIALSNGEGITPPVEPLCDLIANNLSGTSLNDVLTALIISICSLQTQTTDVTNIVDDILTGYTTDCLNDVDEISNIKDVIQTIITKLCALSVTLEQLIIDIPNQYVKLSDLNELIQAYLDGVVITTSSTTSTSSTSTSSTTSTTSTSSSSTTTTSTTSGGTTTTTTTVNPSLFATVEWHFADSACAHGANYTVETTTQGVISSGATDPSNGNFTVAVGDTIILTFTTGSTCTEGIVAIYSDYIHNITGTLQASDSASATGTTVTCSWMVPAFAGNIGCTLGDILIMS